MRTWSPANIKELRESLTLTQKEFGYSLGVTGNYVHLMEKGVRKPSKTLSLLLEYIEKEKRKITKEGGKKNGKRDL